MTNMDSPQWLELFRLLFAARKLHVSGRPVPPVAKAQQDLMGQMTTKLLLVLRSTCGLFSEKDLSYPDLFMKP